MARRKLERLRDEVIASTASWRFALRIRTNHVIEPGGSITPDQRLAEAYDALNAYLDEIVDSAGEYVEGSPETSRNAALSIITRSGSTRRKIVDEIYSVQFWHTLGLTDNDLEHRLRGSHQTVSSARNWLVNSGWLRDSGARKENPSGRPAVVWQLTEAALTKLSTNN